MTAHLDPRTLWALLVALAGCAEGAPATAPEVLITVTGAPQGAALRAFATLGGVEAPASYDVPAGTAGIYLDLPGTASGTVAIDVGATVSGCLAAQGHGEVTLRSPSAGLYQVTIALSPLSPPNCPSPVCLGANLSPAQNLCWDQPLTGTLALSGIWGDSPRLAIAVGDGGVVLRWNGYFFSAEPGKTGAALNAVTGTGPADVWAVGDGGTILHYDGMAWSIASSPVTTALRSVWAAAQQPGALWAVGDGGVILQSSDGRFTMQPSPDTQHDFLAIWGSAPDDFWVAGEAGATYHSQGGTFQQPHATTNDIHAIWGRGPSAVWAVGARGTVLFYDGTTLKQQVQQVTTADLYAVWGDDSRVYAAGDNGTLMQYDGTSWQAASRTAAATATRSLRGLWGLRGGGVLAVGEAGTVLRQDGGPTAKWANAVDPAGRAPLNALWGSTDSDLWAVGQAAVLRYDGHGWTAPQSGVGVNLYGVSGTSSSDVWLVGDQGYVSHYDGNSFTSRGPLGQVPLRGVWARSAADLFIAGGQQGNDATLLRSDGQMFTQQPNNVQDNFNGISGLAPGGVLAEVLVVGDHGKVGTYSGSMWQFGSLAQANNNPLSGVWVSPQNDQWIYGALGLLCIYKGSSWVQSLPAPAGTVRAMGGTGGSDVWAVTSGPSALLRYDGTSFTSVYTAQLGPQSAGFRGIYVGASGSMWIIDEAGGILHKP